MNILFLSDYPAWLAVSKGTMPSHHLFGVHCLIKEFCDEGTSAIIKDEMGGGRIDFMLVNNAKDIAKAYFKSFHYDVVYDVLNVAWRFCSILTILNKHHAFRPRLITIFHHPSFKNYMRFGKADVSVFFSDKLLSSAKLFVHDNRTMISNYWYPDQKWYDSNTNEVYTKVYDFMDNGKTYRDHETFISAINNINRKGMIVCSEQQRAEYKKLTNNIDFFCQPSPNDLHLLPVIRKSKIMVIPLSVKDDLIGPFGNTSYMDAIATGMPVVCSNNFALAQEIVDNNLGCTYVTGNVDSLVCAMQKTLENYDFYHRNMIEFSVKHNIDTYSKVIIPYILNNDYQK